MTGRSDLVDVPCKLLMTKEKAYWIDDGDKRVWVPRSLCEWDPTDQTMAMPEWLAIEKELNVDG
jgi:hypothetical protein